MEPTEDLGDYATVIVRIWTDAAGRVSGVLECVGTKERTRFHGLDTLGEAVAALLAMGGSNEQNEEET